MREINTQSGKLTRLLDQCDEVWLADAEFTVDKNKWQRWHNGESPHVRQFAEVRGLITLPQSLSGMSEIHYDPRSNADLPMILPVL